MISPISEYYFLCGFCFFSFFHFSSLSPLFWAYAGDLGVPRGLLGNGGFFFSSSFYFYGVQGSSINDHECNHALLISLLQWS